MAELLTFEDALARILAACAVLPPRPWRSIDAPDGFSPSRRWRAPTSRRFRARPWTGSRFARPIRPGSCPSRCTSRREPSRRALPAGAAATIATGGAVPDGADAVVPIEHAAEAERPRRDPGAGRSGAHIRPRGGDVQEARRSSLPRRAARPLPRSAPSRPPVSARSPAHDALGSPSWPPGASCARPASRSSRARSSSRTAR